MDKAKILIVEDDIITATNICNRLELLGYDVSATAYSGEEAIELTDKMELDLIIMDIMLPGKFDGIKTTEIIHTKHDIPVIYLTAYTDDETLKRAKITEPFGYLIKPFEIKELQSAIQIALYKHNIDKRLKESEKKYRTLFEANQDGIFIFYINPDGTHSDFVDLNNPASEMLGYTKEEIMNLKFSDLEKNVSEKEMEERKKEIDSKGMVSFESIVKHKNGHDVILEIKAVVINYNNRPAIMNIVRDITERKRAEKILKESEEKYRNLVERASDGITIIQDGIIKFANQQLANMWGGTTEEIIGTSFTNHLHAGSKEELVDRYRRRMASEEVPAVYETELQRKDGSKLYVELNAGVILYEGKSADFVFVRDITERRHAEEALRESERRLSLALEGANIGLWDHNFKTHDVIRSKEWAEMLGYNSEEITNSLDDWKSLIHPDELSSVLEVAEKHMKGETSEFKELHRLKCKDGSYKWILDWGKISERDENGIPI
ncbi:MAG: hypothetical protein A2V66_05715, partial [Ignavibacteria bacterium RBG_13_36_8]